MKTLKILCATIACGALMVTHVNADDTRPNIIVFYTDDHGYAI